MFRLLRKYDSIDKTERIIIIQIFCWLIYAFVLVRIIPLKWFNTLLGEFKGTDKSILDKEQLQLIDRLIKNLRKVKKRIPWNVKCFEEAITLKQVLKKHNIKSTLYLGVAKKNENKLIAHAWLKSGDTFITGKAGHDKYKIVGYYS